MIYGFVNESAVNQVESGDEFAGSLGLRPSLPEALARTGYARPPAVPAGARLEPRGPEFFPAVRMPASAPVFACAAPHAPEAAEGGSHLLRLAAFVAAIFAFGAVGSIVSAARQAAPAAADAAHAVVSVAAGVR